VKINVKKEDKGKDEERDAKDGTWDREYHTAEVTTKVKKDDADEEMEVTETQRVEFSRSHMMVMRQMKLLQLWGPLACDVILPWTRNADLKVKDIFAGNAVAVPRAGGREAVWATQVKQWAKQKRDNPKDTSAALNLEAYGKNVHNDEIKDGYLHKPANKENVFLRASLESLCSWSGEYGQLRLMRFRFLLFSIVGLSSIFQTRSTEALMDLALKHDISHEKGLSDFINAYAPKKEQKNGDGADHDGSDRDNSEMPEVENETWQKIRPVIQQWENIFANVIKERFLKPKEIEFEFWHPVMLQDVFDEDYRELEGADFGKGQIHIELWNYMLQNAVTG
ncbi:unnamed protein product, partial [Amoebophrya sp. A25]